MTQFFHQNAEALNHVSQLTLMGCALNSILSKDFAYRLWRQIERIVIVHDKCSLVAEETLLYIPKNVKWLSIMQLYFKKIVLLDGNQMNRLDFIDCGTAAEFVHLIQNATKLKELYLLSPKNENVAPLIATLYPFWTEQQQNVTVCCNNYGNLYAYECFSSGFIDNLEEFFKEQCNDFEIDINISQFSSLLWMKFNSLLVNEVVIMS
jgi:hypothetical protein